MNSTVKTVVFWLVIGISALLLWQVIQQGRNGQKDAEINFSQFLADVDQGNVREVTVDGMQVRGKKRDGSAFHTTAPSTLSGNDQDAARQGRGHEFPRRE